MKRSLVFALALSFLVGCATTHSGDVLRTNSQDMVVSIAENRDLSDNNYMFIEYTLENKSKEWKDIQAKQILFGDAKSTEILTGDKLSAWIEGAELKLRQNNYNTRLLLGSIVAVAGVTALSSKDTGTQNAALGAMVGAAAVDTGLAIQKSQKNATSGYKAANGSVLVPSTHILAPAKIAPESFIRRWMVIRLPQISDEESLAFFKKYGFLKSMYWPTLETRLTTGPNKVEVFSLRIRPEKSQIAL